jgi:hypothetical protein
MTNRERALAVLNYKKYDRLPIVHFGFWRETLAKWVDEGHISVEESKDLFTSEQAKNRIAVKLGFDFDWYTCFHMNTLLDPPFETKVIKENSDGTQEVLNGLGVIEVCKPGTVSIPAEIDHTLKDRATWEEHYKWRLQFSKERIHSCMVETENGAMPFDDGGLEWLKKDDRSEMLGIDVGSLFGTIRNILGVEGVSYLYMDDETLYTEIIDTVAELCYRCTEYILSTGAKFDFGHFWEDICFKSGPLVIPSVFDQKVGHHYKRITDLLKKHGINLVSLDCDGLIDVLVPTWLNNGVNTMFPIEVGTWHASIAPWREKYGRELRGVGGMDKKVFAYDRAAIDEEIERLKPLVELGGYIPCPDHRIPPDAKWENVQYYCDKMRKTFR